MSYAVLTQSKKKEVVGDAMPVGVLKDSTVQFDKKTNGWGVSFQNGRMYQRKGADYYTRRVETTGSEEDLRTALQNIAFRGAHVSEPSSCSLERYR